MSLGRLLAAGKSLVGGQEAVSRYRMREHFRLPKFVSPTNPFLSEATSKPSEANARVAAVAGPGPIPPNPSPTSEVAPKPTRRVAGLGRAVRKLTDWTGWANPFSRRNQRAGPVRSAVSSVRDAAVQGELRLDAVRVVRNDLSDADLEVVAKPNSAAPDSNADPMLVPSERAPKAAVWRRLAARVLARDEHD